MKGLRLLCFLLLLMNACRAFAVAPLPAEPVLTLQGLGAATAELGGLWQFRMGDNPQWAATAFDDSGWERIAPQRGWGEQGHFAEHGFAWYRLHLRAPAVAGVSPELALIIPHAQDVFQVYWNGRLVGQKGSFPPHASWPNDSVATTFNLGTEREGVLAIRIWKAPLISYDPGLGGGLMSPPLLGSPASVSTFLAADRYTRLRGIQLPMALALLYVLAAIGSFFAWLQHRQQPVFVWLCLFAIASTLQAGWWHSLAGLTYVQEALFATIYQPLEDIATWFLLIYLFGLRSRPDVMRWARSFAYVEVALIVLDGIAVACWAPGWPQVLDGLVSEAILLPELFPVVLVCYALRKRLPFSTWLVAAFALLTDLTLEVGAFLSQGDRFTHWTLWQKLIRPLFYVAGNGITLELLAATLLLFSLIFAVYRSAVEESQRQQEMERELQSAQELQRVLIPEELPVIPGYEISSAYRPAQVVGGDFFQVIPQTGGGTLLILGDVSGKGLTAAMAVALIVGTIRTLAEQLTSPAEMLAGINRRLIGKLHGGFATCVVVRLHPDGGLTLTSAGHPGPFLNDEEIELSPALPLGLSLDVDFEERSARLRTGDRLLLYSDGLLEARDRKGELFGFERIRALTEHALDAAQAADAAIAFGQDDDITVVAVTRLTVIADEGTTAASVEMKQLPGAGF